MRDNPPPTLAKGRAKGLYREVEYILDCAQQRMADLLLNCHPQKIYKVLESEIDNNLSSLVLDKVIADKKKKRYKCIYSLLAPDDIPGRITIDLVQITSSQPYLSAKNIPICITRHCIERVFQRLMVDDVDHAVKISKSVLGAAFDQFIDDDIQNTDGRVEFELSCKEGLFFCEFIDGAAVIKTFVDDSKLRPEQKHITT